MDAEAIKLPGGQSLGKDESVLEKDSFVSTLTTWYLKSEFVITDKRIIAHYPNVFAWVIPGGFNNRTLPLRQVSGVGIDVKYSFKKLFLGAILGLYGLLTVGNDPTLGFVLAVAGFLIAGSGIGTYLAVTTSSGVVSCPIVFWQKERAKDFTGRLNAAIADHV